MRSVAIRRNPAALRVDLDPIFVYGVDGKKRLNESPLVKRRFTTAVSSSLRCE